MKKKKFLCIHGHFYQPPRENPWTEEIEEQESAAPFHDWNERIYHECYLSNTQAKILDKNDEILMIVNNFSKINFNIGPTLLAWLEAKHPETYQDILEADRVSLGEHRGHGNAIAQAFNHMILPLANKRDKITQVRWGLAHFRHHFKRNPEAMWLPETACNEETLEVLVQEGLRYVILEPHQAESVCKLGGEADWKNVASGTIDPRRPYRIFLKQHPTQFIDAFFYDGPISRAVSFEHLLEDAKHFRHRLDQVTKHHLLRGHMLTHLATDGETYGHHKQHGEMGLAYLLFKEAPKHGYQIVNYGEYLQMHPPKYEVRLKGGENQEGTSWSCGHGVKRWKEHCGCRGDGHPEWNQHWRKPLRDALDWLRDQLEAFCEEEAASYLKDFWDARNDYIFILINPSKEVKSDFFKKHANKKLSEKEKNLCLKLLEIQHQAMLMYTSCGWFFTEISGLETVQILKYAAYAIEISATIRPHSFTGGFLEHLARAQSNVAKYGNGRDIYEKFVLTAQNSEKEKCL